jgi:hypothetical protein
MLFESIPTMMQRAREGGYAVGYFECWNLESEGPKSCGGGAEIAAGLGEHLPGLGIARVGSAHGRVPFLPPPENAYRADVARIIVAACALCRSSRS